MKQKPTLSTILLLIVGIILVALVIVVINLNGNSAPAIAPVAETGPSTSVVSSSSSAPASGSAVTGNPALAGNPIVASNPALAATGQFPYELIVADQNNGSAQNQNQNLAGPASSGSATNNPTTINLEAATTTAEQEHGLSDRPSLSPDQGMLFIFPTPGFYQFWMINMSFPLDMIWLDQNFKVVGIKKDATPASYPTTFSPDAPASYVIEVNAGFVDEYGIKEGETLDIQKTFD
jgi:uncharacterized membrane protein (UPF0127 family)